MNTKPLTPTYSKSHAPAKHLLSAKASLKDLLTEGDVNLLVAYDDVPLRWAATATQKNSNADRFLTGLAITRMGCRNKFRGSYLPKGIGR